MDGARTGCYALITLPFTESAMRFASFLLILVMLTSPAFAKRTIAFEPATLGFSGGIYDVLHKDDSTKAGDFRAEYRSGFDMLSLGKWTNNTIAIRPFGGIETTTDGALYGLGGFVFDMVFWDHLVISPSEAVGLYYDGDGKRLGSAIEFRSTMEVGYKFNDASRLTAAFGHISNANLGTINPGTEILSIYYHIPVDKVFTP